MNPLQAKGAHPLSDDPRHPASRNGQRDVGPLEDDVPVTPDAGTAEGDEPSTPVKIKVWVYYNPISGEASLYHGEPPPSFGRRQYDVGPIELDQALIKAYVAAKDNWQETRAKFISAVQAGSVLEEFDRRKSE